MASTLSQARLLSACAMEASALAQLRLLQGWQQQRRLSTHASERPCLAAALNRPKWQQHGTKGVPAKPEAPRRKGQPQLQPGEPDQVYYARTFEECRVAARQLLEEGGLSHALAELGRHPVLRGVGFIGPAALVQELRKSIWRENIPRDEYRAVLELAHHQDTRLGQDVVKAGFLSYYQGDSDAAFKLLHELQNKHNATLSRVNVVEFCSACSAAADPSSVCRLMSLASAQGLPRQPHWYAALMFAYANIGDVEGAKAALQEMSAAGFPETLHTQRALAWAYTTSGRLDEAKTCVETSNLHRELTEDNLAILLTMLCIMGCYDKAEAVVRKAKQHSIEVKRLWWMAAAACAEAGRHAEVERLLREARAQGIRIQRPLTLRVEAFARAGDLPGLEAVMQQIPAEERWRHTACCHLVVDALGRAGEFEKSQNYVEHMRRNKNRGSLRNLATHSYWLSAWGRADEAEAVLAGAPVHEEEQWRDWPRLTADLCCSTCLACLFLHSAGEASPTEEQLQGLFRLGEEFAARGAAPQHRHRYFDLDLSTDLAWPAQLRLLAWLQGLLSTARSGSPVLEYQLEARFLTKEFKLRKEGILAPEDTRAALLGLLRNLGIPAAVSPTDQRLVTVQVADLKLAIGERLRRRGGFEAWPNRALLVRPTRA